VWLKAQKELKVCIAPPFCNSPRCSEMGKGRAAGHCPFSRPSWNVPGGRGVWAGLQCREADQGRNGRWALSKKVA